MHVDFTVSIGQIGMIFTVLTGFGSVISYFRRLERKFDVLLVEHEMLMGDLAIRMDKRLSDFPTRTGRRSGR